MSNLLSTIPFSVSLLRALAVSLLLRHCAAVDTLTMGDSISSLVSAGNIFQLGFFSPDRNDGNTYVGIWYCTDKNTVVWVGNRDRPLSVDPGKLPGVFTIAENGELIVLDGNNMTFLTSASLKTLRTTRAKLLDSGNLILTHDDGKVLWQSFENPTDTFLPGMLMTGDFNLTSWTRTGHDPGIGNFTFLKVSEEKNLFIIQKRPYATYWESGESGKFISYNDMLFYVDYMLSNFTKTRDSMNTGLKSSNSIYRQRRRSPKRNFTYIYPRLVMNSSGELQFLSWDNQTKRWSLKWFEPKDQCSVYNPCGNFGVCNANHELFCKCMAWFEPASPDNWKSGHFSGGCKRKSELSCDGRTDSFLNLTMMKMPDPHMIVPHNTQNENECKQHCLGNCQCEAYSYIDKTNQNECLLWMSQLEDLREEYHGDGVVNQLYVRVAIPPAGPEVRSCGTCGINLIPYPLSSRAGCGDPLYNSFNCSNSSGQLYFEPYKNSYRVTRINPEELTFVIQVQSKYANKCDAEALAKSLQINTSSPFNVSEQCFPHCFNCQSNQSIEGYKEVQIQWKPPLEPPCNREKGCHDQYSRCGEADDGKKRCVCNSNFRWDGRTLNCISGIPHSLPLASVHKKAPLSDPKAAIIVIVIAAVLVLFAISYVIYKRRTVATAQESIHTDPTLHLHGTEIQITKLIESGQFEESYQHGIDVPFFDLESIVVVTDNFSEENKLGRGGFGPVYKGRFPGGQEIAVKRLSSHTGQGLEEFRNEVMLIAKLQHRNLVRLLGYCIQGHEKILVYEYMQNKSLDNFIFDRTHCMLLEWKTRFDIISGIARGLLYLHQDSRLRIIHRDLKTSNILLDEEMNPKISDFGLARMVEGNETESNTIRVIGTYGYMSPEYALNGLFSIKSDVFSFGVVVLEIISGKRNTGFYPSQEALNLLGYAWKMWNEGNTMDLVDRMLVEGCNKNEVLKCITIGLLCTQEDPTDRPTMSDVVFMLASENPQLGRPQQPAFVPRKRLSNSPSSSTSKPESQTNNALTVTMEEGR